MAEPLAVPAELAVSLGVPVDDAKLLWALNAASRRFRGAVRHPVSVVRGDTFTLDGTGHQSVHLPAAPVLAVSSVVLDGQALTEGTDFAWSADGFLRRLGGCWPDKLRCISGVYDHGYDSIPEDIQEVVIDQARALYRIEPGLASKTVGGQSVQFGTQAAIGVTAQWSAAVERYQLNRGDRA